MLANRADRLVSGKMRKTLATLALMALAGTAHADTFHYACKSGDTRYALTVNTDRGIVELVEHGPSHTLTTFRIRRWPPWTCAPSMAGY
jgi:hypothetical protein